MRALIHPCPATPPAASPAADEVHVWVAHFDRVGVAHSPIAEDPFGPVLVFRDPDNIQLELVVGGPGR